MNQGADAAVRTDTKSKILDAAEKLFALNGFQQTSLRHITAEADVNLAAVNYHFHSKDSLIDAVIARRMEPINATRMRLLEAAGPNPALEQIMGAFLNPILDAPAEVMAPLVGRVLSNPDLFVDRVYPKHLATVSQRFMDALVVALPQVSRTELLWRLQFSVGVMTHVLLAGQLLPKITNGLCDITDRAALLRRTVQFVTAGFGAPVPEPQSPLHDSTSEPLRT